MLEIASPYNPDKKIFFSDGIGILKDAAFD